MIGFTKLKNACDEFYPAVLLEKMQPLSFRKKIRKILTPLIIINIFLAILPYITIILNIIPSPFKEYLIAYNPQIQGLSYILIVILIVYYLLEAFYLSFYFRVNSKISFELAKIIELGNNLDLIKSFFNSDIGSTVLFRVGIGYQDAQNFLRTREKIIRDLDLEMKNFSNQKNSNDLKIKLRNYVEALYDSSLEFSNFLNSFSVTKDVLLGSCDWVEETEWKKRNLERWWSKDNLIRIPSLGKNWAYGDIYLIEKYGYSIYISDIYKNIEHRWKIYQNYVEKIENVLLKERGSNIMLISPTIDIGNAISATLAKMIVDGFIHPQLEDQRVFIFDANILTDSFKDRSSFEKELYRVLNQANSAGNVTLVIPYFGKFIEGVSNLGSDLTIILENYLNSNNMHIIGVVDKHSYHQTIETNRNLLQFFEKLEIEDINKEDAILTLVEETRIVENKYKVFFLFQALKEISESADRYYSDGTYSDKIIDLIQEVANSVKIKNKTIIGREEVLDLVSDQTGIPLGDISVQEKEKLENIEDILHKRVVGQDLAIQKLGQVIKRARAGLQNPKRPIGSFLFLGPTGVGKTETTKALAEFFFNDESKIMRFDMSEYNSIDSVSKLIGNFDSKEVGLLAKEIRERQYGVLLLDEFEKSDKSVLDLFLQILDEGQFKDGRGELINARNLIIIATSNAGSDIIFENINKDFNEYFELEVVEEIIKRGIYKPELLNRFDGIILFHPLSVEQLKNIAVLSIEKLNKRLISEGMTIKINDDLIKYLVEVGLNPKFGAREINRVVQNKIETKIADAIISGKIKKGGEIVFVIQNNELELFFN